MKRNEIMSDLTVLSDVELDAVCGGNGTTITITGTGGAGGDGGTAINGAAVGTNSWVINSDLSVNYSRATANGGNGGAGILVSLRFGGH